MLLYGRVSPKCSLELERAELRDQNDPRERGRRLRELRARQEANTLDGTTAEPMGDGFSVARVVSIPE